MRLAWLSCVVALAAACGGGGGNGSSIDGASPVADADPNTPDADRTRPDADPSVPDAAPTMTTRLITAPYMINGGAEFYQCTRITASEDMYVTLISPTAGIGTHHTILAIDPSPQGPGSQICGPLDNDWVVLFASGVGSPSLAMPPGVALPIHAGEEIVFNLHLFNAGDTPITAESAIDVSTIPMSAVQDEAEVVLAGPVIFTIPPGPDRMVSGGCTMTGSTNFFAVFPHMHQLGTHIRVTARVGGVDNVVYDEPYSFDDQTFATWPPIAMTNGDRINVTCTYNNTTGGNVSFGDSSTEEMCFAISYRYPRLGNGAFGAICSF